jgi:hypothetical protein
MARIPDGRHRWMSYAMRTLWDATTYSHLRPSRDSTMWDELWSCI